MAETSNTIPRPTATTTHRLPSPCFPTICSSNPSPHQRFPGVSPLPTLLARHARSRRPRHPHPHPNPRIVFTLPTCISSLLPKNEVTVESLKTNISDEYKSSWHQRTSALNYKALRSFFGADLSSFITKSPDGSRFVRHKALEELMLRVVAVSPGELALLPEGDDATLPRPLPSTVTTLKTLPYIVSSALDLPLSSPALVSLFSHITSQSAIYDWEHRGLRLFSRIGERRGS